MRKRRGFFALQKFNELEEMAGFGGASIMKDLSGRLHIRGGTEAERQQALDWLQRFNQTLDPNNPNPKRRPGTNT
jgi:hypothetical protein